MRLRRSRSPDAFPSAWRLFPLGRGDLLDLGVECGLVEKSGAWLSFEGERIGQGRENARKLLLENPDVRTRLADAVYAAKGIKRQVPAKPEAVEAPAAE